MTYISIFLTVLILNTVIKRAKWRIFINLSLISIYFSLWMYHLKANNSFEYSLIATNYAEVFYRESWELIFSRFGYHSLIGLVIVIAGLLFLEKKWKILSDYNPLLSPNLLSLSSLPKFVLSGSLVLYLVLQFLSWSVYDELAYLLRSISSYYYNENNIDISVLPPYPYIKEPKEVKGSKEFSELSESNESNEAGNRVDKPHVFIVLVESFNNKFVGKKEYKNRFYTPFLNSFSSKSVYVENFYGNSVQTSKGHLATLCSLIPTYRGKVFADFSHIKLQCLPEILRKYGYRTLFYMASKRLNFDNTYNFFLDNGMDVVRAMQLKDLTPIEKKYVWGWGLQDNFFYQRFFRDLDKMEIEPKKTNKPYFAVLTTISNHMPFDEMPANQRFMFPAPQNPLEKYANSIYLTDKYLSEFFRLLKQRSYLKNSIVLVLGDHSFPVGEHGNYFNEVGFYEESFRTPLWIYWQNKLSSRVIKDYTYSQLDIAPTILDLLRIKTRHHFKGISIFNTGFNTNKNLKRTIPLIQPYNGVFLASMQYPYKYVKHLRTRREFFFNVQVDPLEKKNIIDDTTNGILLRILKKQVKEILTNQSLIEQNRIWK